MARYFDPVTCAQCDTVFNTEGAFMNHMRQRHDLDYNGARAAWMRQSGLGKVPCPYCDYMGINVNGVRSHAVRVHGVAGAEVLGHFGERHADAELANAPGIYCIRHPKTGRVYIGSSVDMGRRVYEHRRELRLTEHQNPLLQLDYLLMDDDEDFEYLSLIECPEEMLSYHETVLIRQHDALETGYNLATVRSRGVATVAAAREAREAQLKIEFILRYFETVKDDEQEPDR